MRMRLSLFDILGLLVPAVAVFFGGLMAAVKPDQADIASTAVATITLLALFASISCLWHPKTTVRAFSSAFLIASTLMIYLQGQVSYVDENFPTSRLLALIYQFLASEDSQRAPASVGSSFTLLAGSNEEHLAFLLTGQWGIALLLGTLCGLVAKAMKAAEETPSTIA